MTIFSALFLSFFFYIIIVLTSTVITVKYQNKGTKISDSIPVIYDIFIQFNYRIITFIISLLFAGGLIAYSINLGFQFNDFFNKIYDIYDFVNPTFADDIRKGFEIIFLEKIDSDSFFTISIYTAIALSIPYLFKLVINANITSIDKTKTITVIGYFIIVLYLIIGLFASPLQAVKKLSKNILYEKISTELEQKKEVYILDRNSDFIIFASIRNAEIYIVPKDKKYFTVEQIETNSSYKKPFSKELKQSICKRVLIPKEINDSFTSNTKYFYSLKNTYCEDNKIK